MAAATFNHAGQDGLAPVVEAAWKVEVARRLEEIDSGRAEMVSWEIVRDQVRRTLRRKRD